MQTTHTMNTGNTFLLLHRWRLSQGRNNLVIMKVENANDFPL